MKLDLADFTLEGNEVVVRPLRIGDAEALHSASSENRASYKFNRVPDGIDDTQNYIETALNQRSDGDRFPFTIVWKNRVVGTTSFSDYQPWAWPLDCDSNRKDLPDVVEIGYTWLAGSAQGTRCNTETKYLLLCHAFDYWGVHRVSFRTDERNQQSRKAIERLGAVYEGIRRADQPGRDCSIRNSAFYSIIAAEWPLLKRRMETRLL